MGKLRHWLRSRSATPMQQRETESEPANVNLAPSAEQSSSLEQSSTLLFPDGVEILVNPPDADVDICFVHGLTGNRTSTWTAREQPAPWPKTLLPSELPRACILTYGYDAYVVSKSVASSNRLIDHAMNLLTDLTNDRRRRNASCRPLIFVVHSLGGLVCKEAILLSRNNPNRSRQDFFTHIKGVVFMGTPHKGSWMADWSKIPAKALGLFKSTNRSLLEVLETNNQYLESIHVRFLSMMREQREAGRQLEVACFFEELPLSTVGKVVSKESATFEGYDPITIHANHADMVKFRSIEENGFKRIVGELTAWKPETGREGVIAELQKLLFSHPGDQQAALVGLGGVGKTQIALQLAHLAKNDSQSHQHYSVIWMPALSMASFEQSCIAMINKFGVERGSEEDPKEIFKDFLSSEEAGKWFLIIDNADNIETLYGTAQEPGGIADFIPDCEHGCILFTTRSREVAVTVAQTNIVELPEMDENDARALLQNSLIQKEQMQDTVLVDKLLDELAYLPLAITQASAYMKINKVSIKEYLRLLQNTHQDMVELLSVGFRDGTHYDAAQGAVVTTWIVSFKQIRALHEEAATLLSFAACLEPKAIPRTLLPRLGSEQSMTRAIGTLCGYSFLSQREDGDMFDIHSLVHLATRRWNKDEGYEKEIQQATLAYIAEAFPDSDWENREVWRQYLPHALRLLGNADSVESEDACKLGYQVSRCLHVDGQIKKAVELLVRVVAVRETTLAETHPLRLVSQHELAGAYQANGQIAEAIQLLEHVVTVQETTLAETHPLRLVSQHELAGAYQANGQIAEAIQLLEHVVTVQETTLTEDHPSQLISQHELAGAYQANGQIAEAIRLLEHVVLVQETTLTEDHPSRLASQHELAGAYQANGQIAEAIRLLEHVVLVEETTLTEDHPLRLASQHALAGAYQDNGQIKEAIKLLEHVVLVQEMTLAEDHPDRLASQHQLARAYKDNGQIAKALKLLEHVVAVQEMILEESHPSQLSSQHTLAGAYQANGQITEAVKLLEHVVAVREMILVESHPSRLVSQHAVAEAYQANGQITEAVKLLEHVVMVQERTLKEDHPSQLSSQHALARAYQASGQITKAIQLLEHVIAVREMTLAEDHPDRLASQHQLARAYQANGEIMKAVKL
ncbi:ankyrin protein 3 [Fusarium heterosporum]|uniref:Ankyrin protein 3 n=1 Tax=Fusarium heterosporum TaxID=42747 RepID=A0A8H5TQZ6_FUSHE|nr:ankyrin protein 3 [Fusarium heterosporum]